MPKFTQVFRSGPSPTVPTSPNTLPSSLATDPSIYSSSSRPTTSRSTQSTKSQRRKSPTPLYFPADFCGPPKKPKPMPKLLPKGSPHHDSQAKPQPRHTSIAQPVANPNPPYLHIEHNRSQSDFSSLVNHDIQELYPQHQAAISPRQRGSARLYVPPQSAALLAPLDSDITEQKPPTPESEDETSASMPGLFSVAQLRRRKMDKVMRTFGEPVPAELVFPALTKAEVLMEFRPPEATSGLSGDKNKEQEKRGKRRKASRRTSISVSTLSNFASLSSLTNFTNGLLPSSPPAAQPDKIPLTIRTSQRRGLKKVATVSPRSSISSSPAPSPLVFAHPNESFGADLPSIQRSTSNASVVGSDQMSIAGSRWTPNSLRVKPDDHIRDFAAHVRPSSPFYDAIVPAAPLHIPGSGNSQWEVGLDDDVVVGKSVTRTRSEKKQGWMGEWNRDDMEDVMKKLRALK